MEEKSLLELVNTALETLTEIKRRIESGEGIDTGAFSEIVKPVEEESDPERGVEPEAEGIEEVDVASAKDESGLVFDDSVEADIQDDVRTKDDWKPVDFFDEAIELQDVQEQSRDEMEPQPAPVQQPVISQVQQPEPAPALQPGPTSVTQPEPAPTLQPEPAPVPQPILVQPPASATVVEPVSALHPAPSPAQPQSRTVSRGGITLEFGGFSQTIVSRSSGTTAAASRSVSAFSPQPQQSSQAQQPSQPQQSSQPSQPGYSASQSVPAPQANVPRTAKRMADAASMAAQVCSNWKFQDTNERANADLLRYAGTEQDAISSLSIVDPDSYYIISPDGAIGLTEDGGQNINWLYLPVDKSMASMPKSLKKGEPWPGYAGEKAAGTKAPSLEERAKSYDMAQAPAPAGFKFCKRCGSPVKPTAKFCKNCGYKV